MFCLWFGANLPHHVACSAQTVRGVRQKFQEKVAFFQTSFLAAPFARVKLLDL